MIARSAVQGQSPFYYLILWLSKGVIGHSEVALRLPSLVFSIGRHVFVYPIARRLIDSEWARIAIMAFIVWPQVAFEASDARPYALATVLPSRARWRSWRGSTRGGLWRGSSDGRAGRVDPIRASRLGARPHPVGPVCGRPHHRGVDAGSHGPALVIAAAGGRSSCSSPWCVELNALTRPQQRMGRAGPSDGLVGRRDVAPGGLRRRGARHAVPGDGEQRDTTRGCPPDPPGVAWWLVPDPGAALFGLSFLTPVQLISSRYFIYRAGGCDPRWPALIGGLEPPRIRRFVVLAVVVVSVFELATPFKSGDMRGAIALARAPRMRAR